MDIQEVIAVIGVIIAFVEIRFRYINKCISGIEIKVNDIHNKVFHGKRDKVR